VDLNELLTSNYHLTILDTDVEFTTCDLTGDLANCVPCQIEDTVTGDLFTLDIEVNLAANIINGEI